jgi:sorbose PTS system EIIB component
LQDFIDIALVRVDDRLVHGQILEAWVPFLQASCIIVVDDEVAADFFRETVIRMAVPREIQVIVIGINEFARTYSFAQGCGKKTIVLLPTISSALKVYRLGFRCAKLNIGNVYNEKGCVCCTPSVLLDDEDISDIRELHDAGVQVELKRVPSEKPVNLYSIIEKMKS